MYFSVIYKSIESSWDYRNRLTKIVAKNNAGTITKQVEYQYDLLDRRIEKSIELDGVGSSGAVIVRYLYDGPHIMPAFNYCKTSNRSSRRILCLQHIRCLD